MEVDGSLSDGTRAPQPAIRSGVSLLYVATVPAPIRNFFIPYAIHFRALGWRVDAAASGAAAVRELRDAFDHVYELPLTRSVLDVKGIVRGERAIATLLETEPDIVHVHTPIAAFVTRAAVHRLPVDRRPAVAYTAHGFHFHRGGRAAANALFLTAERVAGRWTDRLVVINDEDERAALDHRIVPRGRLVRMPGVGLDTDSYAPSSVALCDVVRVRERLGAGPDTPVFVVVAELHRNKRQEDAIAALALMRHQQARLALVGEGRERDRLQQSMARHGVTDRVRYLGFVKDVRPALRAATALILPSSREGLARSIMEALALEVPVIASTARGNRELVGADSGLVFPIGDVRGLADAMDWLVDHPEEARQMGLCGRRRMMERYDLGTLIRMHEQMYAQLLAQHRRGGRLP